MVSKASRRSPWLTWVLSPSLFSPSISGDYGISPQEFRFTLPNALQLLLFIVASPYWTSFLRIPDMIAPPSPASFLAAAVSLSGPYSFSLCLYAFSSFTHTLNVGVTQIKPGLPWGSVVKNLSARSRRWVPSWSGKTQHNQKSINQSIFFKKRFSPTSSTTFSLPDVLHTEDFD